MTDLVRRGARVVVAVVLAAAAATGGSGQGTVVAQADEPAQQVCCQRGG